MQKKIKVALVVESPFQILCAYEAYRRESGECEIYVRLNGQESNDSQLKAISSQLFPNACYINAPLNDNARRVFSLVRLAAFLYLRQYGRIFLGSFNSGFMRRLLFLFRKHSLEVFFLDDGMATLLLGDHERSFFAKNGYALFTIFSEHVKGLDAKTHNLEYLKQFVSETPGKSRNLFIGQPLVDREYVSKDKYLECVRSAVSNNPDQDLIYVAHRSESKDFLSFISEIERCSVVVPDVCIEWYLIKTGIKPLNIFGFSSTALLSLSMIYEGVCVIFYDVPYNNYPYPDHHRNIINYFSEVKGFVCL